MENEKIEVEKNENKKPKQFLVFKILGFVALAFAIVGVGLFIAGFSHPGASMFMIGAFFTSFGFFFAFTFLMLGFRPAIHKMNVQSVKYLQNQNKEDLKDISQTSAEISKGAVVTTAKAIKEGLNDEEKIYCKHCGTQIDANSTYCSKCGKKL